MKSTKRRLGLACALLLAGCDCGGNVPHDPCEGIDCSGFGACAVLPDETTPYCVCEAGYHPGPAGTTCAPNDPDNPCLGIDCGGHGYCGAGPDGTPVCACFPGYHPDDSGLWCLPDPAGGDADADAEPPADSGDAAADADADGTTEAGPDGGSGIFPDTVLNLWVREPGPTRLDILVLVDESFSMREEQDALTQRFPELIADLLDPPLDPYSGDPIHPAVEDLHLGVISPDMGTGGFTVGTCPLSDGGYRGCLQSRPSPELADCIGPYPTFLSCDGLAEPCMPEALARDFNCLATLGDQGCGFEQPLEAALAAITTNGAPGGCNEGFLRDDSLLALFFVTDEDDCSVDAAHPEMFDQRREDLGHLNLRCHFHPELVYPVERYIHGLPAARPGAPGRMTVGMIIGVPPDAPQCIGPGEELDGCLGIPQMQEEVDVRFPAELVPSCRTTMGLAYPPRRLVTVAAEMGKSIPTYVDSICKTDWTDATRGITGAIVENLSDDRVCLHEEPRFDATTCMAACFVLERLSDDRACDEDASCPAAWCPAATTLDLDTLGPCRDPSTGARCEPLERDLGLETGEGFGVPRRWCLIRQAERNPFAPECGGDPLEDGWYYEPPEWSDHACHELFFRRASVAPQIAEDSRALMVCRF